MKIVSVALSLLLGISLEAAPRTVESEPVLVAAARVTQVHTLVNEGGKVQIRFLVVDTGGSTDHGTSQKLFFTLYDKGEMFRVDAAFELGAIFRFHSAERKGPGQYQAVVDSADATGVMRKQTWTVDAGKALAKMKAVRCPEAPGDCPAATSFKATVWLTP